MEEFKLKIRSKLNLELSLVEFLVDSAKKLFQNFTILKWSYVLGFSIKDKAKKEFF